MNNGEEVDENEKISKKNIESWIKKEKSKITVKQIVGNKTAVRMLINQNETLLNEKYKLEQDVKRLETFERKVSELKNNSIISSIMSVWRSTLIGFGTNWLTDTSSNTIGIVMFSLGVVCELVGIVFSIDIGGK